MSLLMNLILGKESRGLIVEVFLERLGILI